MSTKKKFHAPDGRVVCQICGKAFRNLGMHLKCEHNMDKAEYLAEHPGAPMMSETVRKASGKRSVEPRKPVTVEQLFEIKAEHAAGREAEVALAAAVEPIVPVTECNVSRLAADGSDIIPVDPTETDLELNFGSQSLKVLADEMHPYIPKHDEHYVNDVKDPRYEIIAYSINVSQPLLLVGDTGSGKSTIVEELASMINQPTRRMSLANDIDGSAFLGEEAIGVRDGAPFTYFKAGLLIKAMKEGSWLIIDELDAAPAGAVLALQMVLNDGYITVPETGEIVVPHKRFRIIATANTTGKGEGAALYAGTNLLNEASLDRFAIVRCGYPRQSIEVEICTKYGIEEALAVRMVECAIKVRAAFERGEVLAPFSTRKLIAWSKAIVALKDMRLATRVAIMDRLVDDREIVDGIIERIIPIKRSIQ